MIDKIMEIILNEYPNSIETLASISYDLENNKTLCDSNFQSINYEKILKNELKANYQIPDMLHFHKKKIIFIEFKNSCVSNRADKVGLKLKGIEGIYIGLYNLVKIHDVDFNFSDIFKLDVNYIIVVSKNKVNTDCLSKGIKSISNYLSNLSNSINLKYYEKTFFSNIDIITEEIFLENYIPQLSSLELVQA